MGRSKFAFWVFVFLELELDWDIFLGSIQF